LPAQETTPEPETVRTFLKGRNAVKLGFKAKLHLNQLVRQVRIGADKTWNAPFE